ncbi:MAG: hypothetical protein H7096_03405 [Flavobacterium sp.]|nr:hypothetical protein [Pedobacter sp.]
MMIIKSFRVLFILHLFIFWLCLYLTAQTQNPRYNFKHLNVQNGLAQDIVYHFLQDSRGYMWLGTRNGLSLYDGGKTINFLHDESDEKSIGGNYITRILEDSLKQIWIGTDAGISLYNRNKNTFSNFTIFNLSGKTGNTYCVPLGIVNQHEIWFIETDTKSIRIFNTRNHRSSLVIQTPAVDGVVWHNNVTAKTHVWTYLSTGTIHYIFKRGSLLKKELFFNADIKKSSQPVLQIVHVYPQSDSLVWLSTNMGLMELNPQSGKFQLHDNFARQLINEIRYAAIAPDGLLWVATGNAGVYTFNLTTKKYVDNFRSFRLDPFSICSNNIVTLYFDRTGNVWCGSYGRGISYTNVLKNYFQKSLPRNEFNKWEGNNNVQWIGYDKSNNLWCIMNDAAGIWKLNRQKKILEHREPVLENGEKFTGRFYKMLFDEKQIAWCIGKDGLFQYNLITNRLRKINYKALSKELFGSYWVLDMIRLKDQSFLFSTYGGLYSITSAKNGYRIEIVSELNIKDNNSFNSLYQDNTGTVYLKDINTNLYVLKKLEADFKYHIIQSLHFSPDINHYQTDSLNNRILLATNQGLLELNRDNFKFKKLDLGLNVPFLNVMSVAKSNNKLWLFSRKGLFCYDEKKKRGRTFTVEDGLPANEFNEGVYQLSQTGEFIAGTTNGLVSFFPERLHDVIYPPLAQLTNIYINDNLSGFVPNPHDTKKISLSHKQNTFSFDFAPIAFQHANESTFEYQLNGYDLNWISSGNTRHARYSRIPPGNYTFQLRAIDANGSISPYSKTLEIEISKAFWQTNLARTLSVMLFLLLVWLIIKWYLQGKIREHMRDFEKLKAVEKERTRIALDMHDDLGGGLSRIKFLSQIIQLKTDKQICIADEVNKIAQYSDEMVDKMGEIVWALNEKNDSLADLMAFTRTYTVEYLCSNNISCDFIIPPLLPEIFISGEIRRNIFLSVKEALHNVIKHAEATQVTVKIDFRRKLKITIQDNGKGIDFNHIRRFGNGLMNIQERIKSIGGKALIKNDHGTLVQMEVPL